MAQHRLTLSLEAWAEPTRVLLREPTWVLGDGGLVRLAGQAKGTASR